jgi:NitT/TauT family transport system permease protein
MRLTLRWTLLALVIVLIWQLSADKSQMVRLFISSPHGVVTYAHEHWEPLLEAFGVTALESISGFILSIAGAMMAGIAVSVDPRLIRWVLPPMIASQVIPVITIAPILILVFGIGLESKIIMAAIIGFFPIFVNFVIAVRDLPISILDMLSLYRPKWWFKVRQIYLPLSLSAVMAGCRISATLAVIGAIVAEFTGAEIGIGKNLFLATRRFEPDLMMVSVVLSALLGSLLYGATVLAEKLFGRWYLL